MGASNENPNFGEKYGPLPQPSRSPAEVYRVLVDLAALDPIERVVFGHGSTGQQCKFCGASDYFPPLTHTADCVWRRAKEQVTP